MPRAARIQPSKPSITEATGKSAGRKTKARRVQAHQHQPIDTLSSLKRTLSEIDVRRKWVDQQIEQMTLLSNERDRLNQQRQILTAAIDQLDARQAGKEMTLTA